MINKNTEFDSYKSKIKPAHIFKLLPNSNMHIGYLEINKSDISNFTNINSIILRNTEKAQNFDFGSFSYLIFKYEHIKLVYKVTYAEQINQDLLLVHLLKPLDAYDLLSIMQNEGKTGDMFYDLRSRSVYEIKDNQVVLTGLW